MRATGKPMASATSTHRPVCSGKAPRPIRTSATCITSQAATTYSVITSYSIHYTKLYELYVNNSMDSEVKRKYPPGDLFILTYSDEELTAMIQTLHANGIKVYLTLAFENHGPDQSDDPVKQVHRAMFGRPNAWQWSEYPPQEYWPWDRNNFV